MVDASGFWTYNTNMKNSKRLKMKLKKHREHIVLFCANTPFKPKVVQSKKAFKRQPKHKGREQ